MKRVILNDWQRRLHFHIDITDLAYGHLIAQLIHFPTSVVEFLDDEVVCKSYTSYFLIINLLACNKGWNYMYNVNSKKD